MAMGPRIGLSEAEMVSLLAQQQDMIARLVARISELQIPGPVYPLAAFREWRLFYQE